MCGIAGILVGSPNEPAPLETLRRMAAMLRHRGPDGWGLYRDERVGLVHTRLSIIDLAGGDQPLANEDESIWIAFNGEVFNYIELREELEARGHRFRTHSDTEVVVHCYEEYGHEAWLKLNGQFAFAIWDRRAEKLWLVRDRMGILPLFYSRLGDRLLFASEAKALFASGLLEPRVSGSGVTQVFTKWSVSAPSSVFDGVQSVPPATAICFDQRLADRHERYWQLDMSEERALADIDPREAVDGLAEQLDRAVRLRLRADVPVGAYLSGGLDSSVIARSVRSADSSPLQTFAVRFADPAFDETREQRLMNSLLGTDHHEILCDSDDIFGVLPDLIWHCETPLLRTAPGPLFLLSGLVRKNDMKVVLTGEGADELLAGYHIFKEDKVRRFWARQADSQARPALLSRLYPYIGSGRRDGAFWQRFFKRGLTDTEQPFYSHRIRWDNTAWTVRFLSPALREGVDPARLEAAFEDVLPTGWRSWRPLARAQAIEMAGFLSPYLLCSQGDRVAMAHGVEVRYPFLDPDLIDFCARLPARFKLRGLRDKVVLRDLARRDLPREIWDRPKQPYRAPMAMPFFGENAPEWVDEMLSSEALAGFGLVEPRVARKLIDKARAADGRLSSAREEMALVGVLTLQLLGYSFGPKFASRVAEARRRLDELPLRVHVDRTKAGDGCTSDGVHQTPRTTVCGDTGEPSLRESE